MIRRTHNGAARQSLIAEKADVFAYLRRQIDEKDKEIAILRAQLALAGRKAQRKAREQAA